jgi:glucokinase
MAVQDGGGAMTERTLVAVDVGGTKTAVAAVRARLPRAPGAVDPPVVLRRQVVPTVTSSAEACLDALLASIAALVDGVRASGELGPRGLEGIGVGTASMVDFGAGRIVESVNLPLRDVALRAVLEERFGLPAVVDNDATAATVGEHVFGAGAGTREMLMLTLGTGVGGGIIAGGHPYRGISGAAGELGHVLIDVDGPPCPGPGCPNHGCLEAYASGTAMGAAALAEARAKPASALGRSLAAGETVDGPLLTRLALAGDADAVALVERTGEYLGAGLVTLVNAFNPELVVIGGGAAAAGELLLAPARRVLAARALRPQRDEVRVVAARFGNDAGIVGAAALALTELF